MFHLKSVFSNHHLLNKLISGSILLLFSISLGCNQQPGKIPFNNEVKGKKTAIKGKVNNWPTDTVYFASLPFHSPFSTFEGYKILTPDKTFENTFRQVDKPFILYLTPEKRFLDHRNFLLFEGFTKEYYKGYCKDFFTCPATTYLIEPGSETIVELTKVKRYGETKIKFLNENKYNSAYYQTTFDIDQRFDEAVTLSKNLEEATKSLKQKLSEYLTSLDIEKAFISPFLYKYTKAEIEFGARKEFLRYLMVDHGEESAQLFGKEISKDIINIVEFDKENVEYATLISQEYNEFLELYLNFKYSIRQNKLITYKEFDKDKFDFAFKELPKSSRYYYLANNLLYSEYRDELNGLFVRLVTEYPNGKLNEKLSKKYIVF